uniref:Uncharacterized protein n=1 Tax=Anopheles maculatus TaxID=74869 RepID=A0A182T6C9_9DIPT
MAVRYSAMMLRNLKQLVPLVQQTAHYSNLYRSSRGLVPLIQSYRAAQYRTPTLSCVSSYPYIRRSITLRSSEPSPASKRTISPDDDEASNSPVKVTKKAKRSRVVSSSSSSSSEDERDRKPTAKGNEKKTPSPKASKGETTKNGKADRSVTVKKEPKSKTSPKKETNAAKEKKTSKKASPTTKSKSP